MGKQAERTKHHFQCPICHSAIGQASFLICVPVINWRSRSVAKSALYADDSTIIASVSSNFRLTVICDPSKCKELIVRKKNNNTHYEQICNAPQCNSLMFLGVTLQSNCKFSEQVRPKLVKANRCLHVLRSLRREQYSQVEINHLFKSLALPSFTYGLSVYGASEWDLNVIQLWNKVEQEV